VLIDTFVSVQRVPLADTAFDASGFLRVGLDQVVAGMGASTIPGFRSGTQDEYRNIKWHLGDPNTIAGFDLVAWSIGKLYSKTLFPSNQQHIEHERERGLPTYNEFLRNCYDGKVPNPPKKTFEEFSSNPVMVERLKRLYNNPDEVDLLVGQQLDEENWPHTSIPRSHMMITFIRLFGGANMDRFNLAYSISRCLVEGTADKRSVSSLTLHLLRNSV